MIFVAGRQVERREDLSDIFLMITDTIKDAAEWLVWAMAVPAPAFWLSVRNEGELLTRTLEGLHGTALVKVDNTGQGLLVHPLKLMEVGIRSGSKELETILQGDRGFRAILKHNELLTRRELDGGFRFINGLGVADGLIFQATTLGDQICIARLGADIDSHPVPEETQQAAAQFAIQTAQTPPEFSACFRYYLAVDRKSGLSASRKPVDATATADQKAPPPVADSVWEHVAPLCNRLLETFSFPHEIYWETLADNIRNCLLNGFKLGFLSLPAAISSIVCHTPYFNQERRQAEAIIDEYMATAQQTVEKGTLKTIRLSQDGLIRSYVFTHSGVSAVVNVDTWGIVTLATCKPSNLQ